jgi:hypothetical protein
VRRSPSPARAVLAGVAAFATTLLLLYVDAAAAIV